MSESQTVKKKKERPQGQSRITCTKPMSTNRNLITNLIAVSNSQFQEPLTNAKELPGQH